MIVFIIVFELLNFSFLHFPAPFNLVCIQQTLNEKLIKLCWWFYSAYVRRTGTCYMTFFAWQNYIIFSKANVDAWLFLDNWNSLECNFLKAIYLTQFSVVNIMIRRKGFWGVKCKIFSIFETKIAQRYFRPSEMWLNELKVQSK